MLQVAGLLPPNRAGQFCGLFMPQPSCTPARIGGVLPRLPRYVLREVMQLYAVGLALFLILQMTDLISSTVGKALSAHASFAEASIALLAYMPSILNRALVMAVPFAVLLGLARLQKDSEIKAILAAGVRPLSVVWPLVLPCILVGAVVFLNAGFWVPAGLERWDKAWYQIYGMQPPIPSQEKYTYAPQGSLYYAGRVTADPNNGQTAQLSGVLVQSGDETLTALSGTWNAANQTWTLVDPWITRPGQVPTQAKGNVDVPQADTLQPPPPDPRKVSNAQLRSELAGTALSRDARRDYTYQLATRYADPFTPIAFALAAGALGLLFRSQIAATGAVVVFVSSFYALWVTMPSLARSGALDPTLAAWLPSLLYLVIGLVLAWRLR